MGRLKMNDYDRVWQNDKRRWLYKHREVAAEAIGRRLLSSEQVHHIDGNILNNNPDNLEVITVKEHCSQHNPSQHRKKLNDMDVHNIKTLRICGLKLKQIAGIFDVQEGTISRICAGKRRTPFESLPRITTTKPFYFKRG